MVSCVVYMYIDGDVVVCYVGMVQCFPVVFFFFKQKTAYKISACLVGSDMCIGNSDSRRTPRLNRFDLWQSIFAVPALWLRAEHWTF